MVKQMTEAWQNGGRPTVISVGFGLVLTLMITVMGWNLKTAVLDRMDRMERNFREDICRMEDRFERRISTLEREVHARERGN